MTISWSQTAFEELVFGTKNRKLVFLQKLYTFTKKIVLDSSDVLELKENKNKQIDIVHKS